MKNIAGAILYHPDGFVLLQHRDDKPEIDSPGKWSLFGGAMEMGETSEIAMLREIDEELGFKPQRYHYFSQLRWSGRLLHIFLVHIESPLAELELNEGQGFDYVQLEEALAHYDLADTARTALEMLHCYQRFRQAHGLSLMFDK